MRRIDEASGKLVGLSKSREQVVVKMVANIIHIENEKSKKGRIVTYEEALEDIGLHDNIHKLLGMIKIDLFTRIWSSADRSAFCNGICTYGCYN